MEYLPGFLANVAPQVDGIIALDDGSRDGSAEFLEASSSVIDVQRVPPERPVWDEVGNHRTLVAAALHHRAEWILCIDADERLERDFRARAERVIRRGRLLGLSAFAVRLRELWDSPDAFRVDGIWGEKAKAQPLRHAATMTSTPGLCTEPRPHCRGAATAGTRWPTSASTTSE